MDLFKGIYNILFNPGEILVKRKELPRWASIFLFISALNIVFLLYFQSLHREIVVSQIAGYYSGIPDRMINSINRIYITSLILTPILLFIRCLFASVILWLIVSLFNNEAQFKVMFSLVVSAELIYSVSNLLQVAILIVKKIRFGIKELNDLQVYLGLDALFANLNIDKKMMVLMKNVSVISIWWLIYMIVGNSKLFAISKKKASAIVISYWALGVLMQIGFSSILPKSALGL